MLDTYKKHLRAISVAADYDDLDDDRTRNDYLLKVTHISVENRSNDFDRIVIGISDGVEFHQMLEEDDPEANNIYWTDEAIYIPEGWFLRVRCTGCENLDELHVFIQGLFKKVR